MFKEVFARAIFHRLQFIIWRWYLRKLIERSEEISDHCLKETAEDIQKIGRPVNLQNEPWPLLTVSLFINNDKVSIINYSNDFRFLTFAAKHFKNHAFYYFCIFTFYFLLSIEKKTLERSEIFIFERIFAKLFKICTNKTVRSLHQLFVLRKTSEEWLTDHID